MKFSAVDEVLEEGVQRGAYPGAVLLVSRRDEIVHERAVGSRTLETKPAPMGVDVVFDLSSLTKPLATTLAVLCLVRQGRLSFDDRVTRFFHNFGVHQKTHVTFRMLLDHSSGLAAHRPYYKEVAKLARTRLNFLASREAKEWVCEQIHREKLEAPTGTKVIYSDLGFMVLGHAVETISGMPLDRFCQKQLFGPLGLRALSFIDLSQVRVRRVEPVAEMIAATQKCPWRKRFLCGEVDDENAWAMGGVAGHAGLFGSARDVDRLARTLVGASLGENEFLPQALVNEMWTLQTSVPGSTRTLGWDTPAPKNSMAGSQLSPGSVGHLGFTGTSLWIDRDRRLQITLLTNRVHPSRDNERIREFRPRIHDAVVEAVA
ncbi:MAG: serine hydrolase [Deltaproteobacteria bacterium]|nr:serine hydrolase [Deltaproteobacteria bacterium]